MLKCTEQFSNSRNTYWLLSKLIQFTSEELFETYICMLYKVMELIYMEGMSWRIHFHKTKCIYGMDQYHDDTF